MMICSRSKHVWQLYNLRTVLTKRKKASWWNLWLPIVATRCGVKVAGLKKTTHLQLGREIEKKYLLKWAQVHCNAWTYEWYITEQKKVRNSQELHLDIQCFKERNRRLFLIICHNIFLCSVNSLIFKNPVSTSEKDTLRQSSKMIALRVCKKLVTVFFKQR
jgi:hypothetical protein